RRRQPQAVPGAAPHEPLRRPSGAHAAVAPRDPRARHHARRGRRRRPDEGSPGRLHEQQPERARAHARQPPRRGGGPMTTRYELRLAGGEVFLDGHGLSPVDLLVRDGRIAAVVERSDPAAADETIDVTGMLVLPGAIDPHVHLGKDIRVPRDPDDAERETASAAAGGVTTMLIYLMSSDSYVGELASARAAMDGNAHTDY